MDLERRDVSERTNLPSDRISMFQGFLQRVLEELLCRVPILPAKAEAHLEIPQARLGLLRHEAIQVGHDVAAVRAHARFLPAGRSNSSTRQCPLQMSHVRLSGHSPCTPRRRWRNAV